MAEMILVSLRLPASVAERAKSLVQYMDALPMAFALGRAANRSTVLRLAVLKGLEQLEAEAKKEKRKQARR